MNSVEGLEFYHFNTGNPGIFKEHCESAFRLWDTQWTETFKELQVEKKIFSDDFLNRELGGLFCGTQAIGFILYTFLDLKLPSNQRVHYSANYPPDLWNAYCEKEDLVMVAGHMTAAHDWRKSNTDFPISELLFSLSVLRFLDSPADRMITYARNNRKMNDMVYRHGGNPMLQNHLAYNVEVDFIEIPRQQAKISDFSGCAPITINLWNQTKTTLNPIKPMENHYGLTIRKQENGKPDRLHESVAMGK